MAYFTIRILLLCTLSIGCAHRARPIAQALDMRIEGRFVAEAPLTDDALRPEATVRIAYSGTRVLMRFVGSSLSLQAEDVGSVAGTPARTAFDVSIDGLRQPLWWVTPGPSQQHVMAYGLAPGAHTVVLSKRTEAEVGETRLWRPSLPQSGHWLSPPWPAPRRILAIGDSITCGYGVLCSDPHLHFDPKTEDAGAAFVALTAQALRAELQQVAWSGRGVWRNRDGSQAGTLPGLFARTLPSTSVQAPPPPRFAADAVVINLGTNDVHTGPIDDAAFVQAYEALLAQTDADSPDAVHILCLGPMLSDRHGASPMTLSHLRALLQQIVARRQAHNKPTQLLEFLPQNEAPAQMRGFGCDYHPNVATQQAMAQQLQDALAQAKRWPQ